MRALHARFAAVAKNRANDESEAFRPSAALLTGLLPAMPPKINAAASNFAKKICRIGQFDGTAGHRILGLSLSFYRHFILSRVKRALFRALK
jgi:hypothetical protein